MLALLARRHRRRRGDAGVRARDARPRARAATRGPALPGPPGGVLAGYAHLDVTDEVEGASAELVVHPEHRGGRRHRAGGGAGGETPDGRLRLWAHGGHSPRPRWRRPWATSSRGRCGRCAGRCTRRIPAAPLPAGIRCVRSARARTRRPGCGSTPRLPRPPRPGRLDGRRPAGAGGRAVVRPGRLLPRPAGRDGWSASTGRRSTGAQATPGRTRTGHDPIGEVYVARRRPVRARPGLGKALTVAGLRHLRHRGLPRRCSTSTSPTTGRSGCTRARLHAVGRGRLFRRGPVAPRDRTLSRVHPPVTVL